MESEFLQEAARAVAFQSTNSIGFRSRSYFAPPKDRFLAFLCTLTHHIVYCYRHGDYQYEKLCAAQQEATFGNYMRLIERTRMRTPNLLYNARVGIYDYCLRSLVDPDPELEEEEEDREWSADAEEIVMSQYASHFPAPAQPAPAATAQVQPAFATPAMAQPEPTEPTEQSPVGHSSVTSGEGVRWEIITHADGNVFLVGPDDAIQINPKIVDDLLNFRISPSSVLEIALQASFSPIQEIPGGVVTDDVFDGAFAAKLALEECSQAGPSGLTAEEKDDAAVAGATITEVSDGEEELPPGRNKGKGKASTLYGGRYLDDYGGVEPGEDEAYVGIKGSEDFEPAEISDEEMELEKDD
ncbi:unnamed protein product [Rhizoctonia solani]|uniref:DUF6532 domain-containing protein n=1 Tax=Rhizoctonia solani TaxID=456999 RepID=A0A8H3DJ40_9AGAM|nr:unnamed protein product [Rhizoctonia solani]